MKKRTLAAFALTTVMALSVTACDKKSSDTNATATDPGTTPSVTSDANTTEDSSTTESNTTTPTPSEVIADSSESGNTTDSTSGETCLLDKWHNIFSGKIGTDEVLMDIYQDGNSITAIYYHENSDDETKLVGNIDGFEISLKDDNQNTLTGTVSSAEEADGHFKGSLTQSNGDALPVDLEFDYACGDSFDNFYEIMGSTNEEIEPFVSQLKDYVASANKEAIAQLISYPINVSVGDKDTDITSSKEFINNYDKIMHKDFVDAISKARTKLLFHNSQGAMLGDELYNIWIQKIDDKIQIIGINN